MNSSEKLAALFDEHVRDEFELKDVTATMETMTEDPYVLHIATLTGGIGKEGVRSFYSKDFIGRWPESTKMERISRSVSADRVIDEIIVSFTHSCEMPAIIPGVPPTGKFVEFPLVVIMKFEGGKIAHEHIYWDHASLLVQVGVLDPKKFPVVGAEAAQKLRSIGSIKE